MPVPFPQGPTYKKRAKKYTVRTGDTWNSIANQNGVPVNQVTGINQGISLTPGVVVRVPQKYAVGLATARSELGGLMTVAAGYKSPTETVNMESKYPEQRYLRTQGMGRTNPMMNYVAQPTITNIPDTYNAQTHVSGLNYQDNRLAGYERLGMLAPNIPVDYARIRGINDVLLVQNGYVKSGDTWVLVAPNQTAGATTQQGVRGDYWAYQQQLALWDAQKYGSPNAARRNTEERMSYKEAKENDPTLTYKQWLMGWKHRQQYNNNVASTEEEQTGIAAVQPYISYSNSNYSTTGRYNTYGGLITWRT